MTRNERQHSIMDMGMGFDNRRPDSSPNSAAYWLLTKGKLSQFPLPFKLQFCHLSNGRIIVATSLGCSEE